MVDYRRLYENMPAPRFQVKRDADGRFCVEYLNRKSSAFFGDMSVDEDSQWFLDDLIEQDCFMEFSRAYDVCSSTRAAVPISLQPVSLLPSGARRAARSFMVFPVLDKKEKLIGVDIVGNTHVVRHSSLQAERDDALMMMSAVFDLSEIGIVVTDKKNKIVRVNQSVVNVFGWPEEGLVGQNIAGFITPDGRNVLVGKQEQGRVGHAPATGELRVIRSDGGISNVLFTAAEMKMSDDRVFIAYTLMDITLRKRMEESLRTAKERADAASRAKTVFLANMSHELRTPLNAIMGFSEMVVNEVFGPLQNERYLGYMKDIHFSAEHLLGIINEVLDMSKIEAGKIELDESNVCLSDLITDVIRMMESRAFGKGVVFDVDVADDIPELYCDRRILRQILINLLVNAVKFSHNDGTIFLEVFIDSVANGSKGDLIIYVRDEGVGIEEDKIESVLEPFGQVREDDEYSPQEGTGLGLPLARAMVQLHGGRLELQSVLGKGTIAKIKLPHRRIVS